MYKPTADNLGAALNPREVVRDLDAAAAIGLDRATFGASNALAEGAGMMKPGDLARISQERPGAAMGGEVIGMGMGLPTASGAGMAAKAATSALGKVAPKVASSIPGVAARVGEAALSGGLYSGTDAAMRGEDVLPAAASGAALGGVLSGAPALAGKVKDVAGDLITNKSIQGILNAKKGTVDKALTQFGHENKKEGLAKLKEFVKKEKLSGDLTSKSPEDAIDAKKSDAIDGLKRFEKKALEYEPKASIPKKEINEGLRGLISEDKLGSADDMIVDAAIEEVVLATGLHLPCVDRETISLRWCDKVLCR
jgi:hypothetical protein